MTEKIISIADVEYVAKLARLKLSDADKTKYQAQLERILEYVSQLKAKNTEGVAPTAHPFDIFNVWRNDVANPFPDIPKIFSNAPAVEESFFRVKKVIE